jgi:hypothetical protein
MKKRSPTKLSEAPITVEYRRLVAERPGHKARRLLHKLGIVYDYQIKKGRPIQAVKSKNFI